MATVSGLYTTVKNTSGAEATFGFLGARGKRLANNATYTVPGDLVAALGKNGKGSQRQFKALERAVHDGDLTIVTSPAVYTVPAPSSSSAPAPSSSSAPAPSSSSAPAPSSSAGA